MRLILWSTPSKTFPIIFEQEVGSSLQAEVSWCSDRCATSQPLGRAPYFRKRFGPTRHSTSAQQQREIRASCDFGRRE
jgi:hypothetical protein